MTVCDSVLECAALDSVGESHIASPQQRASTSAAIAAIAHSLCIAVCCSAIQCIAVCCSVMQCVAVRCSVLQCDAVCCSVLQCVAEHQRRHSLNSAQSVHCSVLQCDTVRCSVLQCGAECYRVL